MVEQTNTKYSVDGKAGVITGGASGLGLATAKTLLASGAKVVLADYNPNVEKIASDLGENCIGVRVDVSKEEDNKKAVDLCVEKFGKIDLMVCSAGIGGDNHSIADETLPNWEKVNAVDYTGVMLANKFAIAQMLKQGHGGAIVNLASMFGLVAVTTNIAYSSAKGGVVNLSRCAGAAYCDKGIRVNAVCPGVIDTPLIPEDAKEAYQKLHPMGRLGEDFEVAALISFLVSDDARFISGAAIPIDGGYTAV